MTRFGMREKDFDTLAGLMADIIVRNEKAGGAVAAFRQNFLTMGYCLPPEQALPLAARILASAVPGPGTAGLFAEHLRRVVESRRGGDE
jgi:hypothetical protein